MSLYSTCHSFTVSLTKRQVFSSQVHVHVLANSFDISDKTCKNHKQNTKHLHGYGYTQLCSTDVHNERGWENSEGKERETPTHLMKSSKLSCWPAVTIFSSLKHGRLYYLVHYHAMHAFTVKERTEKAPIINKVLNTNTFLDFYYHLLADI